jgi:copper(I)-binding protein
MRTWLTLIAVAVLASAAAPKPAIQVQQAEVRIPAGGLPTTTAYMIVKNSADRPDRLVGAACGCASAVTLHESVNQNGVSRMLDVKAVDVPAKGEVSFTTGGLHLMFTGLKSPVKAGDKLAVTLNFERAGPITVSFVADPMAGMMGMEGMAGMDMHHGHSPGQ